MTNRQCFPCTACCEGWLSGKIRGVKMRPGKPCLFLVKEGCGIYEERPARPCRSFKCTWLLEQDKLPEKMRPSECGAIILLDRPWHNRKVMRAVPTGEKIPADTLEWLMAYSREHSLPLLFCEYINRNGRFIGEKNLGYGPPSFVRAVETEVEPEDVITF
jgi:hypothetical protein